MKKLKVNYKPGDLVFFVIALVIAVLLWASVMDTNDPVTTFTIRDIPITFVNEKEAILDNNMVYSVEGSRTVSVSVTTRSRDKDKISKNNFVATADLSDIYGQTSSVKVLVELSDPDGVVRQWEQTDFSVKINTENIVSRVIPIETEETGQVGDGYLYRTCTLSDTSVTITAPESKLGLISTVKAYIDLEQHSADQDFAVDLTFINGVGKEVNPEELGIEVSSNTVTARIMVQKVSPVSLIVNVLNKDAVAEGYRYITYTISEPSISVVGTREAVAGLDRIEINVDAAGAAGNVTFTQNLNELLPSNVTIAGNSTVTISLEIEQEGTRVLEIPRANLTYVGKDGYLFYDITQETIPVTVWGLMSDVETITEEDIHLTLDVTGLGEGSSRRLPEAQPVDGVTATVHEEVDLNIIPIRTETEPVTDETNEESNTEEENEESVSEEESEETSASEE